MNFTREPLIETIITPKEGYKLLVKNSKGSEQEEYLVDSLEVVSFGHSFFFRCLEKPKCFLVPVTDYEVAEVKETRVALKAVSYDRAIKIGGGRETQFRNTNREPEREEISEESDEAVAEEGSQESARNMDRKRDRNRRHRRRRPDERDWQERPKQENGANESQGEAAEVGAESEGSSGADDETQVASALFTTLLPPPTTLISQTISRYKEFVTTEPPVHKQEEPPKVDEKIDDETPSGYDQGTRSFSATTFYEESHFDSPPRASDDTNNDFRS